MNFLQGKNGMERASFDAVWPHLPCLRRRRKGKYATGSNNYSIMFLNKKSYIKGSLTRSNPYIALIYIACYNKHIV